VRVIVISNYYPPFFKGGYELSCKKAVDQLICRHHQVMVVTSNWKSKESTSQKNIKRKLFQHSHKGKRGLAKRILQLHQLITGVLDYRTLLCLCQDFEPDVAYIWNMNTLSLNLLMVFNRLNIPVIFDLGDYWLSEKLDEFSENVLGLKVVYRSLIHGGFHPRKISFRNLLCDSSVLKKHYVSKGFPAESITIIPRGLPNKYILEKPAPFDYEREIRLIFVGRLTREKGVHIAIETVAILLQNKGGEEVHLDIIGSGDSEYTQKLEQNVHSLGLTEHVHFLGNLPHHKLMELLKNYHALLFPAIWVEPFGGVVIEALAQGVCVIASDRGGPAEIITHEHDGILVPPEDPHAMAQAVKDLMQNRYLSSRIRREAINTVREQYSLERVGDKIETYLQEAIFEYSRTSPFS
jgi:glycosyltransferase involved in cell wall biosynthesis